MRPLAHARARGQTEIVGDRWKAARREPSDLSRRSRGSPGWPASSCGRRSASLNATVISSSLRVSFEVTTMPSPQRPWRTRSPSRNWRSPGMIGRAAAVAGGRRPVASAPERAGRRPGRERLAARGEVAARPEGLAARVAPRAGRSPAGTAGRPPAGRRAEPGRARADRTRGPGPGRAPARRRPPSRGPTISSAGISSRNRDGTARLPLPHVARRQAWDRNSRRLARVMPT